MPARGHSAVAALSGGCFVVRVRLVVGVRESDLPVLHCPVVDLVDGADLHLIQVEGVALLPFRYVGSNDHEVTIPGLELDLVVLIALPAVDEGKATTGCSGNEDRLVDRVVAEQEVPPLLLELSKGTEALVVEAVVVHAVTFGDVAVGTALGNAEAQGSHKVIEPLFDPIATPDPGRDDLLGIIRVEIVHLEQRALRRPLKVANLVETGDGLPIQEVVALATHLPLVNQLEAAGLVREEEDPVHPRSLVKTAVPLAVNNEPPHIPLASRVTDVARLPVDRSDLVVERLALSSDEETGLLALKKTDHGWIPNLFST